MLANDETVTGITTDENCGDLSVVNGAFVDENGNSIYENTSIFPSSAWTIPSGTTGNYMLLPTLTGVGDDVPTIYLSQIPQSDNIDLTEILKQPVAGEELPTITIVTDNKDLQYIVIVTWSPSDTTAKHDTVYTATVTFDGSTPLADILVNHDGAVVTEDEGKITLVYPATEKDSSTSNPGDSSTPSTPGGSGGSSGSSSSGGSSYSPSIKYPITLPDSSHGDVSLSNSTPISGATVVINPQGDEGYEVGSVTVVVDATGEEITVTDRGDGTYSFTQPKGKVTVEVVFAEVIEAKVFKDVPPSAWYGDAVYQAYDLGFMEGTGDSIFSPELTVTRGMFVQTLYVISGESYLGNPAEYTDLKGTEYYAEAVAWAAEKDIAVGYDDGTFRGDSEMTREELVQILFRFAQEPVVNYALTYDDKNFIADWSMDAVSWATSQNFVAGRDGKKFAPKNFATRGELAVIFMNYLTKNPFKVK